VGFSILVAVTSPASPQARRWLDRAAVEGPVFELRPDYAVMIIVAEGLRPGPSDEATDALLRHAEKQATRATTSAMFILDGLAEAGRDLAGQLAALHPGARLSWRRIGR
jgi:hypothetical protein